MRRYITYGISSIKSNNLMKSTAAVSSASHRTLYMQQSLRFMITERSFLSEELQKAGVKLDKAPEEPLIEVTPDMINKPNERVRKLVDEVLNLNLMEIGMFFKAIQV